MVIDLDISIPRTSVGRIVDVVRVLVASERSLTRDEISEKMKLKANTGSANNRVISARQFGAIFAKKGHGFLPTELGRRLAVVKPAKTDLLEAIRTVPMFAWVLDRFGGDPGAIADDDLKSGFLEGGLPDADVERAVDVLRRSLAYAADPTKRLTMPTKAVDSVVIGTHAPDDFGRTATPVPPEYDDGKRIAVLDKAAVTQSPSSGSQRSFAEIPIVRAALDLVPDEGAVWPSDRKDAWLKMIASVINLTHNEP
ncbi:hypothetical protein [Polymorphobacter megasporae]|uniref:hypothetical protein n=1 Tax=Glacieibacterium megasporae TaxID=2835787 RepID=UPI001C1E16AC|nr:hypothetical protein [Polymorphobacter megasporae]UAJ10647.1 hypothetical protein KTC28_02505 [Polymorphobacter megasporae]